MIELLTKSIVENSNRIDSIIKHIKKTDRKYCFMFVLIAANMVITTKIIKSQEEKIDNLIMKVNEIESKGE